MYSLSLRYKEKHEKVWQHVPAPQHPWDGSCLSDSCCRWQLSSVAIVPVAVVVGGNCLRWQLSRWQLS